MPFHTALFFNKSFGVIVSSGVIGTDIYSGVVTPNPICRKLSNAALGMRLHADIFFL